MNTNLEFAKPVQWNIENEYNLNDVVFNGISAYTAIDYVPSGTSLSNDVYWKKTGKYIRTDNIADGSLTTPKFAENAITRNILPDVISQNGAGTTVTANDNGYLASLSVDGKAVQDGTPTPDSPVDVQVVCSPNLIPYDIDTIKTYNTSGSWNGNVYTFKTIQTTFNEDGTITLNGTANGTYTLYLVPNSNQLMLPDGNYTLTGELPGTGSDSTWYFQATATTDSSGTVKTRNRDYGSGVTFTVDSTVYGVNVYLHAVSGDNFNNATLKPQLVSGSQIEPFVSYGSIGLNIDGTITPIDLQGNVLASLPDGTKDVLTVDSVGHCVLEKRTGNITIDGSSYRFTNLQTASGHYEFYGLNITNWPGGIVSSNTNNYSNLASHSGDNRVATTGDISNKAIYWRIPSTIAESLGITTYASLNTWLQSNNMQVYFGVVTPQTIDLGYIDVPQIPDESEISITAAITPNIELSYWIDNGLIIYEQIINTFNNINNIYGNLNNVLASSIAKVENDVATSNYSQNSYLMMNNVLYKVTSAIANGENIVPGTNVVATTVMEEVISLTS